MWNFVDFDVLDDGDNEFIVYVKNKYVVFIWR